MTSDVVTFLLTDIVGSTRMWDHAPDDMAAALVRHDELVAQAVAEHDGHLVKTKGEGDSTFSVFGHPADAVRAAVTAQRAIVHEPWPARTPISVRMAIHSGEAIRREGDFFGTTVNRAARLRSVALAGQVLMSRASADAAVTHLGADIALVELGLRQLRDLARPETVFAVVGHGLKDPRDSAPEPALPLPPQLTRPEPTALVGRVAELALLDRAIAAAATDAGRRVVLVAGEPGVGKTRLVSDAARRAHASGAAVLLGRCIEEIARPFQPFADALAFVVRHIADADVTSTIERHRDHLALLVPELGPGSRDGDGDADARRYLLFGAIADVFSTLAKKRPVVLQLDDLQWADAGTLQLLRHLIQVADTGPLVLYLTYRRVEAAHDEAVTKLLADLRREPGVDWLEISGLSFDGVVDFIRSAAEEELGAVGMKLAQTVLDETQGNPFLVGEVLRHLVESGAIEQADDGSWRVDRPIDELGLPSSVVDVVTYRVARVGDDATRALRTASVIGQTFNVAVLAAVLGQRADDLLEVLDRAESASLIVSGADPTTFMFAHAIVARSLASQLGVKGLERLHRRIADVLEELQPDAVVELAHHWLAAGTLGDPARLRAAATAAAAQALSRLAPAEAVRWYEVALRDHPDVDLEVRLGDAQRQAGDPRYRQTLLRAARAATSSDQLVASALANNRGYESVTGGVDDERVKVLEAALAGVHHADSPDQARLLATLAAELTFAPDRDRTLAIADEALAMARRIGDGPTLSRVLTLRFQTIMAPDRLGECRADSAEHLDLARRMDDPVALVFAGIHLANASLCLGDIDDVDAALAVAITAVDRVGQPLLRHLVLISRSLRALISGDLAIAERLADEAFTLGRACGITEALAYYSAQLVRVRQLQGRLDELVPILESIALRPDAHASLRIVLCMVYCRLGRDEQARAVFDADAAAGFATVPVDRYLLTNMASYAEACAYLGAAAPAGVLYRRLLPYRDQVVFAGPTCLGAVALYCGQLAATLDDYAAGDAHFAKAHEVNAIGLRAPIWTAQTDCEWSALLLRRDHPGDRIVARTKLEAVLSQARIASWPPIVSRAEQLLEAAR